MQTATTEALAPPSLVAPASRSSPDRDAHASRLALTVQDAKLATLPSVTMSLTGSPKTDLAKDAVQLLAADIIVLKGNRLGPSSHYLVAAGAVVADLLNASRYSPPRPCYRRLAAASFTKGPVGYEPCRRVLTDLARHGMITIYSGTAAFANAPGYVTRIVPTALFIERFTKAGIAPGDRLFHFSYAENAASVALIQKRAGNRRTLTWKKIKGRPIPVEIDDPKVAALAEPILAINTFMAAQRLSLADGWELTPGYDGVQPVLPDDVRFFRCFNCGDDPAFDWNMGGRLSVVGGGYQSLKKQYRPFILINDEPTVEIDVSACHLTIAHGLLGLPLPAREELYQAGSIDREVVKLFVNSTLGGGKTPKQWTGEHCKRFDAGDTTRLRRQYPLSMVTDEIVASIPSVKTIMDSDLKWYTYQWKEGEIATETTYLLSQKGICALPNHDSTRVTIQFGDIAKDLFSSIFHEHVGIYPYLKLK